MIPEASHGSADYGRTGDSGSSGLNSDDLGRGSRGTLEEDKTKKEWSEQELLQKKGWWSGQWWVYILKEQLTHNEKFCHYLLILML